MSTDWKSVTVQCPYWRGTDVRGGKSYISCEGIEDGTLIQLMTNTAELKQNHIEKYCANKRYWNCPICQVIDFFEEK